MHNITLSKNQSSRMVLSGVVQQIDALDTLAENCLIISTMTLNPKYAMSSMIWLRIAPN